jgi:DNA polymerase
MPNLYIDLETRSTADLRKVGAYEYANHPTTQVMLFAWALDDDAVQVWHCLTDPAPRLLLDALRNPAVALVAHNASFERTMLTRCAHARALGLDPAWFGLVRFTCTAARAACFGLPRTLAGAGKALGLAAQKDAEGHRLMLQMCRPRRIDPGGGIVWWEDADRVARLAAYCRDDVVVERLVDRALPALPDQERRLWRLTEMINDRGIGVDTQMLTRAALLVDEAAAIVNRRMALASGGALRRVTDHRALATWLRAQLDLAGWDFEHGDAELSVARAAVDELLANPETPPLAREVLLLRREGGKSSASKYRAIMNRTGADGRLRGPLVYSGAAATRRWSSRGAQLQNMPRGGAVKNPAGAVAMLKAGASLAHIEAAHGPGLVVASELLRPCFQAASGCWLARGDYSQIEARVLPWLAGEQAKLDAFQAFDDGRGPDIYKVTAARITGKAPEDVTKDDRQALGKVPELALGFQGGVRAFQSMAKLYRVSVSDERAEEIKIAWRAANPRIVALWRALNDAALACMRAPVGDRVRVRDQVAWDGSRAAHAHPALVFRRTSTCMALALPLPGSKLFYWHPRLERIETPFGPRDAVTYMGEDAQTKQFRRFTMYGGLLAENITQSTARDVMGEAMLRLAITVGVHLVMTVHDEVLAEVRRARCAQAEDAAELLRSTMTLPSAWRTGLPVAADASAADRYLKGE